MNAKDQTLRAFLSERLGEPIDDAPTDVLKEYGHTDDSEANCEVILIQLHKEHEEGKFAALATDHLILSGYDVVVKRVPQGSLEVEGIAPGVEYASCSHIISGKLSDDPSGEISVVILGGQNKGTAFFSKQSC